MSAPPTEPGVAGTSAVDAQKLIGQGWNVDASGLWSIPGVDPCPADVALRVAAALAKNRAAQPAPAPNWWTHLAGTMPGTAGMGIFGGILAAVIANPPPEMGLSPTVVEWLKWALPVLGTLLLGSQLPRSIKAAGAANSPAPQTKV